MPTRPMPMLTFLLLLAACAGPVVAADAPAAPGGSTPSSAPAVAGAAAPAEPPPHELHWQTGTVTIQGGMATITLPARTAYLQQADARYVVENIWHNPPDPDTLGLIRTLPVHGEESDTGSDTDNAVYATVSYDSEVGHIKDDDAATTNYDDLLKKMQQDARDQAPERRKAGYFGFEILGWAEPPHYDKTTHMVYWATSMKADGVPEPQMNYNLRLLGARGVLVIDFLEPTAHLPVVRPMAAQIITAVAFTSGNGYGDFKPGYDKVAAYGIAGLIAGGVLLKTGFFSLIFKFLLAFIKPIIIGCIAVFSVIGRFLGFKKKQAPAVDATAPAQLPPKADDPGNTTPFNSGSG